uniref:Large ribosomal subunit protein P2 n=1 Tax=Suricata suricatta TaxID=37032 RepID=A0A673TAK0_SURSU
RQRASRSPSSSRRRRGLLLKFSIRLRRLHFIQQCPLARPVASAWELACIYSALTLHDDEGTVQEEKTNALIKAVGVNVEPLWLGFSQRPWATSASGSLVCKVGAGGSAPAAGLAPPPLVPQLRRKKWKERKKNQRSLMMMWALGF